MQSNSKANDHSALKKLTTVLFAAIAAAAVITSLWLAHTSNYGGHHDIYLMLGTFLSVLRNGDYVPSRFTGYPVAELGIGAAAWAGGSSLSNTVNYLLFLGTTLLFPFCFHAKTSLIRYLAFAALALTSTVMAFDNIISIDYPWSVSFWVLGTLCLRRCKQPIAALVPLGVAIGCRPIFAIFVCASLLLVGPTNSGSEKSPVNYLLKQLNERWVSIATTLFIGGLFYLPAWLKHGFALSWISASPPDNQRIAGLVARFGYKLILSTGFLQFALLLCLLLALLIVNQRQKKANFLLSTSSDNFSSQPSS